MASGFSIDPYVYGNNMMQNMLQNQSYNNAYSAQQAQMQNQFQIEQNAKAMLFNQQEAAKSRDWQMFMSNTAHQREVRDLRAAGLNPVLSALNGNGAAVTSGATAQGVTSAGAKGDTDESVNGAIANVLGSIMDADYRLQAQAVSAESAERVAEMYTAMSFLTAQLGLEGAKYSADRGYEGTKYSADRHKEGTVYSANMANEASHYATDNSKYGLLSTGIGSLMSLFGGDSLNDKNLSDYMSSGAGAILGVLDHGVSSAFGAMDQYISESGYPYIVKLLPFMKSVYDFFGYDPSKGPSGN